MRDRASKRALEAFLGEFQHVADGIDAQAEGVLAVLDHDLHRPRIAIARRQAEKGTHVDDGDDAAAKVEEPGDAARRQQHHRRPLRPQHVAHLHDGDSELLPRERDGEEPGVVPCAHHAASMSMPSLP